MMEFSAKTVEEAKQEALSEIGCTEADVDIKIVQEPVNKLFGLVSKPAVIEVIVKPEFYAKKYLAEIFAAQRLNVEVEQVGKVISLSGLDAGKVIGKHGQTLEALQTLVNVVVNRYTVEKEHIELDAVGYRAKRRVALEKLAEATARKVMREKKSVTFEPMPRAERRIIHETIAKFDKVKSESAGEEPYRKVEISLQ